MTATTPVGQVLRDAGGVRLRFERTLGHPVADVWSAVADPDRLDRWFGRWSGDPATGTVDLVFHEDGSGSPAPVRVLACVAPTRLLVDLPSPDGPWRIDLRLAEHPEGTSLVFEQPLSEPYDASSTGPGWQYYLDRLAAVLDGSAPPEDWEEYAGLGAAYAVPHPDGG